MLFEVTILGSGAAIPTAKRNPTAQYILCNDRHFLVDCGEGTQSELRKRKIHFQKIQHILISHLHGDHYFGLVGLLSTLHLLGRDQGITIYGPTELEQIIRLQLEVGGVKLGFQLDFVPLNGRENRLLFEDRLVEVWTFPLNHRVPTNGFLIQEKQKERALDGEKFKKDGLSLTCIPKFKQGLNVEQEDGTVLNYLAYTFDPPTARSYAYCSDTKFDVRLIEFIQGATVLYHEATFLMDKKDRAKATYHSTAEEAATIAKLAGVKKLLIGHFSARYDTADAHLAEAQSVFENTNAVEDGDVYRID
jgi:ribonuclease Z